MRLKNIKLAGFKSFVDQTTVPFPGNLTAIVGPNGCGKSNIIDAVRWVMGESSAKQLRGESLDDVIFNGSTGRKPVGQASIELCFDNADGSLGGQYGSYSEIAIRREITRDGQSNYYLNNTRCRRKDITDLFLGTGLGPRSYAIIEQGTISRVVEAKPEELRSFVEEAAGISKYKERRRETESRIEHTQENLARLNDLRDELARQLNHLQRQANAAEKYQVLKQEERLLRAQLQALRYRLLDEQLIQQNTLIKTSEEQLQAATDSLHEIETSLEQQRAQQSEAHTLFNDIQARYYELGTQISRIEQSLQHQRERRQQLQAEQAESLRLWESTQEQLKQIQAQTEKLTEEVALVEPQWQTAQQTAVQSQQILAQAEQILREWQHQWEQFNRETAQATQHAQVEQTRIQHLEQHIAGVNQRIARLEQERQGINLAPEAEDELELHLEQLQEQRAQNEEQLQTVLWQISSQREQNQTIIKELDAVKNQVQTLHGQRASLEALQQAALGQQKGVVTEWLQQKQLQDNQRLAQLLQVEAGWEAAVETVLGPYLQAVYMDELKAAEVILTDLPQGNLTLVAQPSNSSVSALTLPQQATLFSKVKAPVSLSVLLNGVYVVDSITEALGLINQLAAHESVVTRAGIWLGNGWLRVAREVDATTGILQRKRELEEINIALEKVTDAVAMAEEKREQGQAQLHEFELQRDAKQRQQAELIAKQAQLKAEQQVKQARLNQLQQRAQQINTELQDCFQQLEADQKAITQAQNNLTDVQQMIEQQAAQRDELLQVKANYQTAVDAARLQASTDQNQVHQYALQLQAAKMQLENTQHTHTRLEQQLKDLQEKQTSLQQVLGEGDAPLFELTEQLEALIAQRSEVEQELQTARQRLEKLEHDLRGLEKRRQEVEQRTVSIRNELEQTRMAGQALTVRGNTLQEQLAESGHDLATVLAELPADASDAVWDEQLGQVTRKIERLGPINLAAIDEFATQSERKNYLDTQHADLTEALNVLEGAMQKIDKETRARFKETFDKVNENFQALFPALFGGGRASLELVGEDVLTAGVNVMAQPPGKRNSTIHLLSGGEKALTAVSLVFSFFQLNPAPFCMLDEVDAPLDDANVGRFCRLVQQMAEKVQFIFISHNKLAIEMATHLAGVTMKEPGVSRMVAVDIEEAMALAEA